MNLNVLKISVLINLISVLGFAASMPFNFDFGSYLFSMFIALSYALIACGFKLACEPGKSICGSAAVCFGTVYAAIILTVYFTQLTTVRLTPLPESASVLLDFKQFGLMFNYDLLGYSMMSLSAFFAGLTIDCKNRADKALKTLLLLNIIFFISCLTVPMLNIFRTETDTEGTVILEVWCAFFIPITILCRNYFKSRIPYK